MKLINAKIKSKKEAAQRLINGEVFYSKGGKKIYFSEANIPPFCFDDRPLKGMWDTFIEWQIEDPYAELKEAHAAGKTIQVKGIMDKWVCDHIPTWKLPPERYRVKPEPKTVKLPKITDELWEDYNDTDLMTWDKENNRPNWTQIAVDFACVIKVSED